MWLKRFFRYEQLILVSALALSVIGAYFSIYGIASVFSSTYTEASIMGIFLEICKVVTVGALSLRWNTIKKKTKVYLITAVIGLSVVTSSGIYCFLSSSFQENNNKMEVMDKKKELFVSKKQLFEKNISQLNAQLKTKYDRFSTLDGLRSTQEKRLDNESYNVQYMAQLNIKSADKQILNLQANIDTLNKKISILNDSVSKYDIKIIDLEKNKSISNDVGTLKYLSKLTGIGMDKIINFLILFLLLFFDPLALVLIATANNISKKTEGKKDEDLNKTMDLFKRFTDKKIEKVPSIVYESKDDGSFSKKEEQIVIEKKEIQEEKPKKTNDAVIEPQTEYNEIRSALNLDDAKRTIYLDLLNILYNSGEFKEGDLLPQYPKFVELIKERGISLAENQIKDFLIVCTLVKIVDMSDEKNKRFSKDFEKAKIILTLI